MSCSQENEVILPVLDISQISDAIEGKQETDNPAVATFREACEEWGFFYVVNHGIPADLLQNVESVAAQLGAMPAEIKEKLATSYPADVKEKAVTSPSEIIAKAAISKPNDRYSRTAWSESFNFPELPHSNSVQEICDKIWPEEGNPKFCEAIRTYIVSVADLASKISKIIVASLGLDVETFYHSDFENCSNRMRIHIYFSDGKMSMEEEIPRSHTDLGCFTILYQDKEGGLQVRSKEGKWMDVKPLPHSFVINVADCLKGFLKPLPHSFVINVADCLKGCLKPLPHSFVINVANCLKAWSNGRYRSAEDRVVYKGWKNRISVPYFVLFPPDK